ncbi:hypothetical protein TNCV_668721 [Trichonephila clavipes]|nr:hypothetical protein TNCV_668721 [Trichonephila clavipes]
MWNYRVVDPRHRETVRLAYGCFSDGGRMLSRSIGWRRQHSSHSVREPETEPKPTKVQHEDYWVAAVAKWSRYRIVAGLITSSSRVPVKTRRVGDDARYICRELKRPRSRWCGVVVRRLGASSGVVQVT